MKITLGALVLCKILVLDPATTKDTEKTQNNTKTTISTSTNMTMSRFAKNINDPQGLQKKSNKVPQGYKEKIVTGVVEKITSKRKLVEVERNKKFKYKDYHSLVVKTNDIERLVIQANSCALADDIIEEDNSQVQVKKEAKKKTDQTSLNMQEKKVQKKKITKKIDNEDYVDVSDDEELMKVYSKYLEEHKKRYLDGDNSVRIVDLSTGEMKNLKEEEPQNVSKKVKKMDSKQIPNVKIATNIKNASSEKKEVIEKKEPVEKKVVQQEVPRDVNLFDFFENKKKQEIKKETVAKKILEDKKAKEKKKKELLKKKEMNKKIAAYKKYKEENPSYILEAFKIILFE